MPYIYPKKQAPVVTYRPEDPPPPTQPAVTPPQTQPPNFMNQVNGMLPDWMQSFSPITAAQGLMDSGIGGLNPIVAGQGARNALGWNGGQNPGVVPSQNVPQFSSNGGQGGIPYAQNAVDQTNQLVQGLSPAGGGGLNTILQNEQTKAAAAAAAAKAERDAEIQREWDRVSDLAGQYGLTKERLIDVYMNPSDPGSQQNFAGALKSAHSDDLWARAYEMATGFPPGQVEWDEHSLAEDSGYRRRDPLEGHSEAIKWLEQQGEQEANAVSSKSFDEYKGWLGK
jgi:hypothetical protein